MPLTCFARDRGWGDPSPAPPSSSATSVYWTHLGDVSLTWSRASLGLVLIAELHLDDDDAPPARFAFRPWLPWRRRGSKRFSAPCGRVVGFSWDLSRARLAVHRPEPVSRYSLHVCVDGELALAAGDLSSSSPAGAGFLLSRRETAVITSSGDAYTTAVSVAGEVREVSLAVVDDAAMWVAVDGEKALQVRRLRWKFRGSERLDLPRRGRVRVTWDLHGWLSSSSSSPDAAAVFVLQFETDDDADDDKEDVEDDVGMRVLRQSSFGKQNATGGGGGESWWSSDSERRGWRRGGPFRCGSDTSPSVSIASTSAMSSAGSVATVSEWAIAEEANALKDGGGFSLVVRLWKKRK